MKWDFGRSKFAVRIRYNRYVSAFPRLLLTAALAGAAAATVAATTTRAGGRQSTPPSVCALETPDRVVAVGDVHGALPRFVAILQEAKLIDNRRRWSGGRAVLVQTGDVLDRGPDSRAVIDLLRKLENEASRAGGRVVSLLGNHEVMRMLHDLRYVSAGEYDAFRTGESGELRERAYEAVAAQERVKPRPPGEKFDERAYRKAFVDATPLGFLEMRVAFSPSGEYGKWILARPAVAKINGVVFVHGGISPALAPMGCDGINAKIRAELAVARPGDPANIETLAAGPQGPLWYRGFFQDPPLTPEEFDAALAALGAKAIVVGHTVSDDRQIHASFGGRVYQIDTGMLAGEYYPNGVPSALEFSGANVTAIYEGGKRQALATGK